MLGSARRLRRSAALGPGRHRLPLLVEARPALEARTTAAAATTASATAASIPPFASVLPLARAGRALTFAALRTFVRGALLRPIVPTAIVPALVGVVAARLEVEALLSGMSALGAGFVARGRRGAPLLALELAVARTAATATATPTSPALVVGSALSRRTRRVLSGCRPGALVSPRRSRGATGRRHRSRRRRGLGRRRRSRLDRCRCELGRLDIRRKVEGAERDLFPGLGLGAVVHVVGSSPVWAERKGVRAHGHSPPESRPRKFLARGAAESGDRGT